MTPQALLAAVLTTRCGGKQGADDFEKNFKVDRQVIRLVGIRSMQVSCPLRADTWQKP